MAISRNCIAPLRPEIASVARARAVARQSGSSPRPRQAVAPLDPIGHRTGAEIAAPRAPHVPGERRYQNVIRPSIDVDLSLAATGQAGREKRAHAEAAHVAERHRADWFVRA